MIDRSTYNERLYAAFARVGGAMASPQRLKLLELLSQSPRTVDALAARAGLSVQNASQHLQKLHRAGLVEADRHGQHVTYRLAGPDVRDILDALRHLARTRGAEVDRVRREYVDATGTAPAFDGRDLQDRIRHGEVTVIDVRPPEEYEAGHVPGALSIPLARLEESLDSLSRDRKIVAFCRGPYCGLALEAVRLLRDHGFDAAHVEDGVWELDAKGMALAVVDAAKGEGT